MGTVYEHSLDGGLRYSMEGGSYEAYRDLFSWQGTPPSVADFQQAVEDAFAAWTVPDPVSGLGTSLSFVADLGTTVNSGEEENVNFGAEIDFFSEDTTFPFTTGHASVFVRGETVRLTFGVENYPAFAISGSDVFINNNFAALHTLDGFKNLLTHEIGHTLGLADVEFASEFIDDNYDETDSATALATLTNSWARLVNPVDPGDLFGTGLSVFQVPNADPGFDTPGVDILMESQGSIMSVGVQNPLQNDDFGTRQYLYPSLIGPTGTGYWVASVSGNWHRAHNWFGADIPDGNTETARFGTAIPASRTVLNDLDVTVQGVEFDNANKYAIAGVGSVNLESTAGNTSIDVAEGQHEFQLVVNLLSDTEVMVTSGSTRSFNNALNLGGNTLTKMGNGELAINNALTAAGGSVQLVAGSISGNGTIGGDVNNDSGTISPGNRPRTLAISGNYSQASGAELVMEITGDVAGIDHDLLAVSGDVQLAGTLQVKLIDGFTPIVGSEFDLFDFGVVSGSFQQTILPEIGGLAWNTSDLLNSGILRVVPEPGGFGVCLLAAALAVLFRRRHKVQHSLTD